MVDDVFAGGGDLFSSVFYSGHDRSRVTISTSQMPVLEAITCGVIAFRQPG
jgi:hypothetical protein